MTDSWSQWFQNNEVAQLAAKGGDVYIDAMRAAWEASRRDKAFLLHEAVIEKEEAIQTLIANAIVVLDDGSLCWCCLPFISIGLGHSDHCAKAREITEGKYER